MELKYRKSTWCIQSDKGFKSHLYGIEITLQHNKVVLLLCLNRTFMELKFRCTGMASTPITWFKSHLYGIEITDYLVQRLKRYLFKSHLYGIEICGICSFRVTCQVSLNRTFMELKCHIIHIVCISLLMFKSHLYGIEIFYRWL